MHLKQFFGVLATTVALVAAEGDSDVAALTGETFDDFVKANELVLAECKLLPGVPPPLAFVCGS